MTRIEKSGNTVLWFGYKRPANLAVNLNKNSRGGANSVNLNGSGVNLNPNSAKNSLNSSQNSNENSQKKA